MSKAKQNKITAGQIEEFRRAENLALSSLFDSAMAELNSQIKTIELIELCKTVSDATPNAEAVRDQLAAIFETVHSYRSNAWHEALRTTTLGDGHFIPAKSKRTTEVSRTPLYVKRFTLGRAVVIASGQATSININPDALWQASSKARAAILHRVNRAESGAVNRFEVFKEAATQYKTWEALAATLPTVYEAARKALFGDQAAPDVSRQLPVPVAVAKTPEQFMQRWSGFNAIP